MNKLTEIIQNSKPVLIDIAAGIDQITGTVTDTTKLIVNRAVVPIAAVVLLGFLIFAILKLGKHKREGDDYSKPLFAVIVLIILIALDLSAPVWLWTFIA